jgi:hypothetical protein
LDEHVIIIAAGQKRLSYGDVAVIPEKSKAAASVETLSRYSENLLA